jgi:hypothetical protein
MVFRQWAVCTTGEDGSNLGSLCRYEFSQMEFLYLYLKAAVVPGL